MAMDISYSHKLSGILRGHTNGATEKERYQNITVPALDFEDKNALCLSRDSPKSPTCTKSSLSAAYQHSLPSLFTDSQRMKSTRTRGASLGNCSPAPMFRLLKSKLHLSLLKALTLTVQFLSTSKFGDFRSLCTTGGELRCK